MHCMGVVCEMKIGTISLYRYIDDSYNLTALQ